MAKTRGSGLSSPTPTVSAGGSFSGGAGGLFAGGSTGQTQMATDPTQLAATAAAAAAANNANFPDSDDADFHQLRGGRNYYTSQNMDIDQQVATIAYVSPDPEAGTLYSPSQNLNWALAHGQKLTGQQKYMDDNLTAAMHNLGQNIILQRYDHRGAIDGLLKAAGYTQGYDKMSAAQLQKALVGMTFTNDTYLSTSFNDFKNAGNLADVFTSRAVRFEYKAAANTQGFMPGKGPAPNSYGRYRQTVDWGEIVLGKGQTFRITGVRFNGNKARSKGTQTFNLDQVVIEVEVGTKKNG